MYVAMFDGPIVDVAIGLIFFYTLLSLVCTSIQELVAGLFGLRSKNLARGMESLLGECEARKLYAHPLIRSLSKEGKLPSYLRSSAVAASASYRPGKVANARTLIPLVTPGPCAPARGGGRQAVVPRKGTWLSGSINLEAVA